MEGGKEEERGGEGDREEERGEREEEGKSPLLTNFSSRLEMMGLDCRRVLR